MDSYGLDYHASADRWFNAERLVLFAQYLWERTSITASTIDNYCSGVTTMWRVEFGAPPCPVGNIVGTYISQLKVSDCTPHAVRDPVTPAILSKLAEPSLHCPPVVRCAILFAFLFMLRGGEYCVGSKTQGWQERILKRHNVSFSTSSTGARMVSITLGARKNNVEKYPFVFTRGTASIPGLCPVAAYEEHLRALPPAARSADTFAFTWPDGKPLTVYHITKWLRTAATALGLNPATLFPHSLRIGGATAASRAGLPIEWIMQQGFWKSLGAVLRYCRSLASDHAWCTDVLAGVLGRPSPGLRTDAQMLALHASQRATAACGADTRQLDDDDDEVTLCLADA